VHLILSHPSVHCRPCWMLFSGLPHTKHELSESSIKRTRSIQARLFEYANLTLFYVTILSCSEIPKPREASPGPDLNQSVDLARPCPYCNDNPTGYRCPQPIPDPAADPTRAWHLDNGMPPGHAHCGNWSVWVLLSKHPSLKHALVRTCLRFAHLQHPSVTCVKCHSVASEYKVVALPLR